MDNDSSEAVTTVSEEIADRLMDSADAHFELYEMEEAIDLYNKAYRVLQTRRELEEKAVWALAALGDCHFILGDLHEALRTYIRAFNLPTGYASAYVLLRAGQVYLEMGNTAQARHYLLQAYLIEGDSLFANEDEKYFTLIKNEALLRADEPRPTEIQPEKPDVSADAERRMRFFRRRTKTGEPDE